MYSIYFSPAFERKLNKLVKNNPKIKPIIQDKLEVLIENPSNGTIRLHKLSGKNNWSISINRKIRIIFSIRNQQIICLDIGGHDEVY